MTITEAIALLGGISAFIGGIALIIRQSTGDRFQRRVSESAALLSGYTDMVKNLRTEVRETQEAHEREIETATRRHKVEIDNLLFLHGEERKRWHEERVRLEARLTACETQVEQMRHGD